MGDIMTNLEKGVFSFRYEHGDKTVTIELSDDIPLNLMLEEIKLFLQAVGYGFGPNEEIEVVDNSYPDDTHDYRDIWKEDQEWLSNSQKNKSDDWDDQRSIWSRSTREKSDDWQVDGPTEFAFNGIKETDFFKERKDRVEPAYGAWSSWGTASGSDKNPPKHPPGGNGGNKLNDVPF